MKRHPPIQRPPSQSASRRRAAKVEGLAQSKTLAGRSEATPFAKRLGLR